MNDFKFKPFKLKLQNFQNEVSTVAILKYSKRKIRFANIKNFLLK